MIEPIRFETTIYKDALSLLLSNKTDIKSDILDQLQQGDPCLESVNDELRDLCDELILDTDKIMTDFEDKSCEELMEYISYKESDITFDYGESEACDNRKVCAFRIPCEFDVEKYLKN